MDRTNPSFACLATHSPEQQQRQEAYNMSDQTPVKTPLPRRRTSPNELAILEEEFALCDKPSLPERDRISSRMSGERSEVRDGGEGMSNREIQVWFQNKRQAIRRQKTSALMRSEKGGSIPIFMDAAENGHENSRAMSHDPLSATISAKFQNSTPLATNADTFATSKSCSTMPLTPPSSRKANLQRTPLLKLSMEGGRAEVMFSPTPLPPSSPPRMPALMTPLKSAVKMNEKLKSLKKQRALALSESASRTMSSPALLPTQAGWNGDSETPIRRHAGHKRAISSLTPMNAASMNSIAYSPRKRRINSSDSSSQELESDELFEPNSSIKRPKFSAASIGKENFPPVGSSTLPSFQQSFIQFASPQRQPGGGDIRRSVSALELSDMRESPARANTLPSHARIGQDRALGQRKENLHQIYSPPILPLPNKSPPSDDKQEAHKSERASHLKIRSEEECAMSLVGLATGGLLT